MKRVGYGQTMVMCVISGMLAIGMLAAAHAAPSKPAALEISFIGDIMAMEKQYSRVYDKKTGVYDFHPWFTHAKSALSRADFCVANLETTLAGKELVYQGGRPRSAVKDELVSAGLPQFNCPEQLAVAMKYAGINIVTMANNHALDRGFQGAMNTLAHLKSAGLRTGGAYESPADAAQLLVVQKDGIRVAILPYTLISNGHSLRADKAYAWQVMTMSKVAQDVDKARAQGVDSIVAFVHWGTEYVSRPDKAIRAKARKILEAGVDVIVGTHPHVVQIMETMHVTDRFGVERDALVAYSLGNFISNMKGSGKDTGLMLTLSWEKQSGAVRMRKARYTPMLVRIIGGKHCVIPAKPMAQEDAFDGPTRAALQAAWERTLRLVGVQHALPDSG